MNTRRACSLLLVLILIVSMFSVNVFADTTELSEEILISENETIENEISEDTISEDEMLPESEDALITEEESGLIEADDLYAGEADDETDILTDEETEKAVTDTDEAIDIPESETYVRAEDEEEHLTLADFGIYSDDTIPDVSGMESELTAEMASEGTDPSYVTTGTYSYTSNEGSSTQETDTFTFREDCFMRSSFSGCEHLMLLSSQAALASASWYSNGGDQYEKDPSDCGKNIKNMLADMGFEDVETNKYYTVEKLDNSAAVAVGHRKISAFGKDYTLLAIIPRSAGYKQEWAGNFTVGSDYIHEGFKAGRDEILRFVKQYITGHKISGNLKVWITGHSRGSAISNLLAGFFAGGGIQYFGDNVTITPQDIYCYAFATPKTIRTGLSLAEALSVGGARGDGYADDTPGDPFISEASGTVDPLDEIYGGIRNYPVSYDFISYLPMEEWGFTYYGNVFDISEGLSIESMKNELAVLNPYVYGQFINGGDYRDFREKTFDTASLTVVDKEGGLTGREGLESHVRRLVFGLLYSSGNSTAEYVDSSSQTTLQHAAGIFGMGFPFLGESVSAHTSDMIKPALIGYLAYASKELQKEGRAENDAEAADIAIEELIQFITGTTIDPETATIDQNVEIIARYIADEADSEVIRKLKVLIADTIPTYLDGVVRGVLKKFHKNPDQASTAELVLTFLSAAAYGAEQGTEAWEEDEAYRTGKGVRKNFYYLMKAILAIKGISIPSDVIGVDEEEKPDGSGSFRNLVENLLPMILKVKDDQGNEKEYETLADAADASFIQAIDIVMNDAYKLVDANYNAEFRQMFTAHVEGVKENITKFRETAFNVLLYTGESFNTAANVCNVCSLLGNGNMVSCAHYNEVYTAWAKAAVIAGSKEDSHYISHVDYEESEEYPGQHLEYWTYHDTTVENKDYKDRSLSEEGRQLHTWGEPVYKWSDDYSKLTATRVCNVNPEHVQSETAKTSGKVTKAATTEAKGKTTYTASFKNPVFTKQQKTVANIPAIKTISLSKTSFAYSGKVQKPTVTVKDTSGKKLKEGTDYTVTYQNAKSKTVGTYKVTVMFQNKYSGTSSLKYKITRADYKISLTPVSKELSSKSLKSRNLTFTLKASVKEKASRTFSMVSVPKKAQGYISISKDGKITVKKGLGAGTYTVQVKVSAKKTANYNASTLSKKIKIIVK